MRRNIYFIAVILLSATVLSAQPLTNAPLPATITYKGNTDLGSPLENFLRTTYTYNQSGQVIASLDETWDEIDLVFKPFLRNTYSLNGAGKPILIVKEFWIGTTWKPTSRENYTYDVNGHEILWTEDKASGNLGTWILDKRRTTTYTDNQKIKTQDTEELIVSAMVLKKQIIHEYNASHQLSESQTKNYKNSGTLTTIDRIQYFYDPSGRITTLQRETFAASSNLWTWQYRHDYLYVNNDEKADAINVFNWMPAQGQWVQNSTKTFVYTPTTTTETEHLINSVNPMLQRVQMYNQNGQQTMLTYALWNNSLQALRISNKTEWNYTAQGAYAEIVFFSAEPQSASTVLYPIEAQVYTYPTVGLQNPMDAVELIAYPNPVTELLHVQFSNDLYKRVDFVLYDTRGQAIATGNTTQSAFDIQMNDLAAGTYFLQVNLGGVVNMLTVQHQ